MLHSVEYIKSDGALKKQNRNFSKHSVTTVA